jgi:ribosome-associated translation inhibitor RaiA
MEIIFHAHHADISPRLQHRAERALRKTVSRLGRTVDAIARFEEDGPTHRVELVLHAARGKRLVASGEGRTFGPALTMALGRLGAQIEHVRRPRKAVTRRRAAKSSSRRKLTPA